MADTNHLDGQHRSGLDECLKQLAEVLKAVGVEELTIESDFQYHLINDGQAVEKHLIDNFCAHITQMHHQMVSAD